MLWTSFMGLAIKVEAEIKVKCPRAPRSLLSFLYHCLEPGRASIQHHCGTSGTQPRLCHVWCQQICVCWPTREHNIFNAYDGREISVRNVAWPGSRIFVYGKNMPVIKVGFTAFHHFLAIFHPLPTWSSVQSAGSPPYCLFAQNFWTWKKEKKKRKIKYRSERVSSMQKWVPCFQIMLFLSENCCCFSPHCAGGQSGSKTDSLLCDIKTVQNVVRSKRNH